MSARSSAIISIIASAAHQVSIGDLLIIAVFSLYTEEERQGHESLKLFVDKQNQTI